MGDGWQEYWSPTRNSIKIQFPYKNSRVLAGNHPEAEDEIRFAPQPRDAGQRATKAVLSWLCGAAAKKLMPDSFMDYFCFRRKFSFFFFFFCVRCLLL